VDAVGVALDVVADVPGASLDGIPVPSQGGRSAALEAVEPRARLPGIAVGLDKLGDPIARLERGADLDQECALELASESVDAKPLG
jgi:hypothetical protein